ncbi:hypothetical protein QW71_35610 [Paenibacillus sp. IHB B 3415]|nr:hypothetical protein QW71_35610 [Paenibacillus sp. IHB B 3415]
MLAMNGSRSSGHGRGHGCGTVAGRNIVAGLGMFVATVAGVAGGAGTDTVAGTAKGAGTDTVAGAVRRNVV